MNSLKLGMTKQEVIEAIGAPNSTSAIKNVEHLKYESNAGMFYSDDAGVCRVAHRLPYQPG